MKRWPVLFVVFLLVVGLSVTSPIAVNAKTINLRLASWMPAKSVDSDIADYWTKMMEERTKGKVKFTVYKASALGFFKDHYDMVIKGISDISFFTYGLNPGRMLISEGLHLPFVVPSSEVGGKVYSQLYKEFAPLRAEFNETKVLGLEVRHFLFYQISSQFSKTLIQDQKSFKPLNEHFFLFQDFSIGHGIQSSCNLFCILWKKIGIDNALLLV